MKANIYTTEGKVAKSIELPESIFDAKWNADLVAQVINAQAANRRAGTAHTKDRSEVSGGGKKPWQQKGTGRARHGSSRSPIWRHGGVTFGPRNDKSYKQTIPRGMKISALYSILSAKVKNGKVLFVETLAETSGKTKDAEVVMKNLSKIEGFKTLTYKKVGNVYMTTEKGSDTLKRSFRNLSYVNLHNMEDLNPLDIANARYLVITNPEAAIEYLSGKKSVK
ncbi:MAG: large subunit ribosomal protein [Patescibacteria group bacterium]|nr:large subunit ribosomal protein [Patescibacteria group bacterium]